MAVVLFVLMAAPFVALEVYYRHALGKLPEPPKAPRTSPPKIIQQALRAGLGGTGAMEAGSVQPWSLPFRVLCMALADTYEERLAVGRASVAAMVGRFGLHRFVEKLRRFMGRVWGIFTESESERAARLRLGHLKQLPSVVENPNSAFAKAVGFLEDRFEDMIAFLAHPRVPRNSLLQSGACSRITAKQSR